MAWPSVAGGYANGGVDLKLRGSAGPAGGPIRRRPARTGTLPWRDDDPGARGGRRHSRFQRASRWAQRSRERRTGGTAVRRPVAPAILSRQRAAAACELQTQAGLLTLWAASPIGGPAAASVLTPQASCDPPACRRSAGPRRAGGGGGGGGGGKRSLLSVPSHATRPQT